MTDTVVTASTKRITYDDGVVRGFILFSVIWGLVGMLVGLLCAFQLAFPALNFDTSFLTFGRIRPLHTNAVIFALVGNMLFAGIYHSSQRLLKTRMASDLLSRVHLYGWQLIILGAAITLPLGITQSKEYAELEWWLDIMVALVWVVFAVNYFWTLGIRNEKNLYVAIWFYIATIITIAVLYIVNNLAVPLDGMKSYGVFAGAQDALTQWWYGHNAVAFFLTTPILGIMYYYLPKAAERPVYSYRLSIIHFWALIFIYIWAGPHHLLYTALPDWAQSLGMIFSLMLWAPSWGGMLNGLLTLRGAWHKVRTDPVLKFFVAGVTFYGMATFEGPLLSIKSVSALGHYTDWIIGHVHGGALGWNGFMAAGMFYWLVPKLFGTKLHSTKAADAHFWLGTIGILIYMVAMWISGVTHGLMWRAENADGVLEYRDWATIIDAVMPMYHLRALGGALYIVGWVMMMWNLFKTIKGKTPVNGEAEVTVLEKVDAPSSLRLIFSRPVFLTAIGLGLSLFLVRDSVITAPLVLAALLLVVVMTWLRYEAAGKEEFRWHDAIERRPLAFSVLVMLAVLAGGVVELLPGLLVTRQVPMTDAGTVAVKPYTPLELEGRDIYVSEGCYLCHSQMIRPFLSEKKRYGDPSRIEESMYDHPFQWGSKRTGPDLARVGTKYGATWHYEHMLEPTRMSQGSIMPKYPWLLTDKIDPSKTKHKLKIMRALGVPYEKEEFETAEQKYLEQAGIITKELTDYGADIDPDSKLVALIGYLLRLGKNEKPSTTIAAPAATTTERKGD